MGRNAGMKSGEIFGDVGVKSHNAYVPNKTVFFKGDFNSSLLSGVTSATAAVYGEAGIPVDVWSYSDSVKNAVSKNIIVPTGIPETARMDISLYWTTLSGVTVISGTDVVWDIDYRAKRFLVSGADLSPAVSYYTISGGFSNSTTTSSYSSTESMISGAINKSVVTVPASGFRAGDLLQFLVIRDAPETTDTLNSPVQLIATTVEYV